MEVGKGVSDETLQERMDELVANKCCTLVYTVSFDFLLFLDAQMSCKLFSWKIRRQVLLGTVFLLWLQREKQDKIFFV